MPETMRQSPSLAIGVRITKADDTAIAVDDLAPLLRPTRDLIATAISDGHDIDPLSVRKSEHTLTLASIEGIVIFLCCNSEETSDFEETRYLIQERRKELATAFSRIMTSSTPPSEQFAMEPQTVNALFLLAAAFQAAQRLALEGEMQRCYANYSVEAMYLRVEQNADLFTFDIVPTSLCLTRPSDALH